MSSLITFFFIIAFFTCGNADHNTGAIWNDEWHAKLPNTPMPNIIKDLIKTDTNGRMSESSFPVQFTVHGDTASNAFYGHFSSNSEAAVSSFLLQKNMFPGMEMKGVSFGQTIIGNRFIPRRQANRIPFSSTKLDQILDRLSITPGSEAATHVESTLRVCEASPLKGEIKFCATSLESMIDFVTSELGSRDLKVIATTVKDENQETTYKITSQGKEMPGDKLVACHPQPYPYTVFYCHTIKATKAYVVPLVGMHGSIVNAATVCHSDTTDWGPNLFKALNVKPGTQPICHVHPKDHLLWVPTIN